MLKKTLLVTAVGALTALSGKLALTANSSSANNDTGPTVDEPELTTDCVWCFPRPSCYPGDPCAGCG